MRFTAYLSITVVDKDVPCAVVFQVGDLQAARVANLGRLEGGIEGLDFHHRFWIPSLYVGGGGVNREQSVLFLRIAFKHHDAQLHLSHLHPAC